MADVSELTLVGWQARQIQKAAGFICHFVESTREDRLRWCPSTEEKSQCRSVMDMAGECVNANERFLAYLQARTVGPRPESFDAYETVQDLKQALTASADALAEEIRGYNAEDLNRMVTTHRGVMPVSLAIQFPLRNMTYHMGQINMIQMLYGDTVFHITPEFMTL